MSFKEELMSEYTQQQLDTLQENIRANAMNGYRSYSVWLEKSDLERSFPFRVQVVGYGKVMWDQLVELGFQPKLKYGGMTGQPFLEVRW